MTSYKNFRYYYPPRPEHKILPTSIKDYDNSLWIGQPKLNGSCTELYINEDVKVYNRHKAPLSGFKIPTTEILELNKGNGWMVLCGEYMNKSKKNVNGKIWNDKFVIWDIIVYNGEYLTNTTFDERIELLDELFGKEEYDEYLYKISENVYRVKSFENEFEQLYKDIIKIDMLEGWVLKKKNGKLERGMRESNNTSIQLKVRKPTKNYEF
jgi:hypothetical protein